MPRLSIVIPAYNEEKRIGRTLDDYGSYFLERLGNDYEIFVVLNGCRDRTLDVVKDYSKKYSAIKYIDVKEGIGKGGALIEGFKIVNGDYIGFVDADGATKASAYYKLYENIGNHDGIIASRWIKGAKVRVKQTLGRRIASRAFNIIVRILFGITVIDSQCLPASAEIYAVVDGRPVKERIGTFYKLLNLTVSEAGKDYVVYSINNSVLVPSLNERKTIELARASSFVVRNDKKRCYTLKLQGGRIVKVSEDHPLLVFEEGKFIYKQAKYLRVGERVPVLIRIKQDCCASPIKELDIIEEIKRKIPSEICNFRIRQWLKTSKIKSAKQLATLLDISYSKASNFYRNDTLPLSYYLALCLKNKRTLKIAYHRGKFTLPTVIPIDKDIMRLIGYFLSEGCIDKGNALGRNNYAFRLSFNRNEVDLISESKNLLKDIFNLRSSTYTQNNVVTVSVQSRMLCILFKDILECGMSAKEKRLPSLVYSHDMSMIGNLLDAYFLGDGYVTKHTLANSICLRANSSSMGLITGLQFILLKFGVTSGIYSSRRGKEKIGPRKLNTSGKVRWNLNVQMGANLIRLFSYMPVLSKKNRDLLRLTKGKLPSLFERKKQRYNDDLGLATIVKIDNSQTYSQWYDFKVQSSSKPNMNFVHDCGIISHNCGAKLFTKKAIKSVVDRLGTTRWAFDIDLLYLLKRNGFKLTEVPTEWDDQAESQLKMHRVIPEMLLAIVRLRLVYSPFSFVVDAYNKVADLLKSLIK